MTIEFRCPDCSRLLRTSDEHAGVLAKCPQCGRELTVPADPSLDSLEQTAVATASPMAMAGESDGSTPDSPQTARPQPAGPLVPCPMCGSPIAPRAAQCPQCGESLLQAARGVSPTFRTGFVIERAWAIFKREMGAAMLFFWIAQIVRFGAYFAAVTIISFTLPQGLGLGNPAVGPLGIQPPFWQFMKGQAAQTFVYSIILCGISSLVMPGCTRSMLRLARGEPVDAMDVFRGGPFLFRYAGIELILSGINFVFAVTVSLPATWLLLTAMQNGFRNPGEAYLAIGLTFVGLLLQTLVQMLTWPWAYILVDSNPPGIASLLQAFSMTRRHLVGMFLLMLLSFLLAIGGMSAICIGLLFVLPFGMLTMAVAYCELSGQRTLEG